VFGGRGGPASANASFVPGGAFPGRWEASVSEMIIGVVTLILLALLVVAVVALSG